MSFISTDRMIGSTVMENGRPVFYGMVWPPLACACGVAASMIVNRGGKTRCAECDRVSDKAASPRSSTRSRRI